MLDLFERGTETVDRRETLAIHSALDAAKTDAARALSIYYNVPGEWSASGGRGTDQYNRLYRFYRARTGSVISI